MPGNVCICDGAPDSNNNAALRFAAVAQVQRFMHGAYMHLLVTSVDDDEDKLACQSWRRALL